MPKRTTFTTTTSAPTLGSLATAVDPLGVHPGANNTGWLKSPTYDGTLTPMLMSSVSNGGTYNNKIFDAGILGNTITATNVTFNGCVFESNQTGYYNVAFASGGYGTLNYCTIRPRSALVTAPPLGWHWPSTPGTGASLQRQIPFSKGYQYGVIIPPGASPTGAIVVDHCDIWGFGNAVDLSGSTQTTPQTFTNNWIHDPREDNGGLDHTDGICDTGTNNPQSYVTITGNTIAAAAANTNGVGFQGGTGGVAVYSHLTITNNFFAGFSYFLDPGHGLTAHSYIAVTGNVFATDVPWLYGPVYSAGATPTLTFFDGSATSSWSNNTLRVKAGSVPLPSATIQWATADNGKYVRPDGSYNATDYVAPATLAFSWANYSTNTANATNSVAIGVTNANTAAGSTVAGGLLLAVLCNSTGGADPGATTIPSGFTTIYDDFYNLDDDYRTWIGYKLTSGSETPSYTASWANVSRGTSWALLYFTGATGIDVTAKQTNTGYGATMVAPSVTPTVATSILATLHFQFGGQTPYAAASGMTQRTNTASSSSDRPEILTATLALSGTSATGTKSASQVSGQSVGVSVVIK